MDGGAVAGAHFHFLDPAVFGEVRGQNQILIVHRALRGNVEGRRHFEDLVGRSNIPALRPLARWRSILRIARGRAGVDPGRQRVDLGLGERTVVCEMSVIRIGEPGWHLARDHLFANSFGPGPRLGVSEERHGSDFTRAVALLAMRLENGKNVFVEDGLGKRRRQDCREASEPQSKEPTKQRTYRGTPGSRNGRSGLPLSP